ncbi:MAG TPA: type II secretion system protein GspN [Kofleriaceae bacterium]|nr:type II secretion system protein GspN [Kofleriaceae bacterium]
MSRAWLLVIAAACSSGSPKDDATHIRFDRRDASLAGDPVLRNALAVIGVPVSGKATVAISIDVPHDRGVEDYARATGSIRISCTACQLGDDRAKISTAFGDVDFGHLAVGKLDVAVDLANGKATVSRWVFESPDLALALKLQLELAPKLGDSKVDGCIRFHPAADLVTRAPRTYAVIETTGAELRGDGNFHIKLAGTLDQMKRLNLECGP